MTKQEFDRIVNESVAAGADRKDAEAYVAAGFKLPVDGNGKPVFESVSSPHVSKSRSAKKKRVSRVSVART